MKAKAEYTPNGYVCNKCGSRMDAIITPPLSTLGKMKLVCNNCNKYMSKENILKKFRKKTALKDDVKSITIEEYNEIMLYTETLLEKAIDQTREETIKKTLKEIRDYIRDNEKLGYENRVLVGDEIYAKLSIMYDKSLINK